MRTFLLAIIIGFTAPLIAQAQTYSEAIDAAKSNMMVDPVVALEHAETAARLSGSNANTDYAQALWLQGEALTRINKADEAKHIIKNALDLMSEADKSSKLYGDLLVAAAGIASAQADYGTALQNYQAAHDLFNLLGEKRSQAMTLLNVANIHADARDFNKALSFYRRAQEAYSEDPQIELARLNNVATAHRELGDYPAALNGLEAALAIADEMDSDMLRSRILTNMAAVHLDAGHASEARIALNTAQTLETANPSGWQGPITGMFAKLAFVEGDIMTARSLMDSVFDGFDLTTTPAPFLEFHQAAFEIYETSKAPEMALQHLAAFKRLDDEKRNVAANANTALLSAEFDFATQELQIAQLRTETLEAEVELREARERQRLVLFSGLALAMLIALLAGLFHYRKMRKSRDAVSAANAKLNTSNQALEKALKAKSEFLATTSHEIRTPLNAILGMSQLMSGQKGLDAETQERAELVHSSGLTMKAIVDDILDMSKIESGTISVHDAPCALVETLTTVTDVWRGRADEKSLTLLSDFDDCPIEAVTDERKLRQIVLNLMSNAVKFTETGEVSITAALDETASEPTLCVTVRDTGCGIPSDQFDYIFEPFTQVDSSTTRQFAGTGLGLSIARNFAYAMGGDITVESELGKGSVFTLRLPVKAVIAATDTGATDPLDVLLVEPNFLRQGILEALLDAQAVRYHTINAIDELDALSNQQIFACIFVSKDLHTDDAGEFLSHVQTLSDRFETADFLLEKASDCALEDGLLRLSGVTEILPEGGEPLTIIANLQSRLVDTEPAPETGAPDLPVTAAAT